MSRYNRCKECYNMKCVFVTGEREDINTSECADFRPMTNADRIRVMTDEELAAYMGDVQTWGGCPNHGARNCKENCADCWLDWLKSPVEVVE